MTALKPFSVAKLAERWGCSRVHIYWLIENKQITPFNIGPRSIRIAADEVERFEKCGYVGIETAGRIRAVIRRHGVGYVAFKLRASFSAYFGLSRIKSCSPLAMPVTTSSSRSYFSPSF